MKQTRYFLAIFLACFLSLTPMWAQLEAPTMPQPQTLENGKTYYLYNIEQKNFLGKPQYSYVELTSTESTPVTITQIEGKNEYFIQSSNKFYLNRESSGTYLTYKDYSQDEKRAYKYASWSINMTNNIYTFQTPSTSQNYVATEFIGFINSEKTNRLSYKSTENIQWQLFSEEAGDRFIAETALFNALTRAKNYNYYLQHYVDLYNNRDSQIPSALKEAANSLNYALDLSIKIVSPSWSNYAIALEPDYNKWENNGTNNGIRIYHNENDDGLLQSTTVTAHVKVDKEASLRYKYELPENWLLKLKINGTEKQNIQGFSFGTTHAKSILLAPGVYTLEWTYYNTNNEKSGHIALYEVSIENTPIVQVDILEPGSLGTEVLYQVNHLKDVRRLKVIGEINDDDWAKIKMMINLYELDLSEATSSVVPNDQFRELNFLHKIILPPTIKTLGTYSFYKSNITNIILPNTLTEIKEKAFAYSALNNIILPESVDSLETDAFYENTELKSIQLSSNIKTIPKYCFMHCENLQNCKLPEGLKYIKYESFHYCEKLNTTIPTTVQTIEYDAFNHAAIQKVIIPEKATIGDDAFSNNNNLEYIEFPTTFYRYDNSRYPIVSNCDFIKTIVLRSPTVVGGEHKENIFMNKNEYSPTLVVPNYLVNAYKLDEYWYNYKIEGFNTADTKNWYINSDLVLNARDRFEGNPNLFINPTGSMKINGDKPMEINKLTTIFDFIKNNRYSTQKRGQVFSKCDNISIIGNYEQRIYIDKEKWYLFSLPVDFKVGDVTNDAKAQFVIRYYDGAERAKNGMGGSWKNYKPEDIIPAGTGFIIQSSQRTWFTFTALNNESKQYPVSYKEFSKSLQAHPSAQTANKGWNLVGNPYLTYYNIHKLNFTAPITVTEYDDYDNIKYVAYSVVDDDYALKPNEGFFVQCPEEITAISFPLGGRQLTSVIESQNASRPIIGKPAIVPSRQLVDIELQKNGFTDKTRVVFNEKASLNYETACDAAKFMSEGKIPQIYTIDEERNTYAINERPEADGSVKLGFKATEEGNYTFHLTRCAAELVYLTDKVEGKTIELTAEDYNFTAKAGTDDTRFVLSIKAKEATGIESANVAESVQSVEGGLLINGKVAIYSTDGRLVKMVQGQNKMVNLPTGIYVVKANDKVTKVSVNN